jgi:hypothetical protein
MNPDRFAFDRNLCRATQYRRWRGAFWPPASDYHAFCLDLGPELPPAAPELPSELAALSALVEAEWLAFKAPGGVREARLRDAAGVGRKLRRIAELLPTAAARRALTLRASAVERGYDEATLSDLVGIDEDVSLVAGLLATWCGKQKGGVPSAFGCARDEAGAQAVAAAMGHLGDAADFVRRLHAHLRLSAVPAFAATRLFFMAGEGNRHPKHIAYFLPEDEGVKRSPFKKTFYFTNTHRALVNAVSLPLARRLLDIRAPVAANAAAFEPIPTLGVLAHEVGHAVHREGASFAALNAADRWASLVLQEMSADVFGVLVLAEVLAPPLGLSLADVVVYHLAECLRYIDRGLGFFPDSDGMYLQLNYLASFGALTVEADRGPVLTGEPEVVLAAFRSLARVLADTVLDSEVPRSLSLYRTYGPAEGVYLSPLMGALAAGPPKTIDYLQEMVSAEARQEQEVQ